MLTRHVQECPLRWDGCGTHSASHKDDDDRVAHVFSSAELTNSSMLEVVMQVLTFGVTRKQWQHTSHPIQ